MVTSHYHGNSFFLGFCGALQNFAGLHGDVGGMLLIAHLNFTISTATRYMF